MSIIKVKYILNQKLRCLSLQGSSQKHLNKVLFILNEPRTVYSHIFLKDSPEEVSAVYCTDKHCGWCNDECKVTLHVRLNGNCQAGP